jgi:methylmalonyl-CoA mutase
VRTAEPFEALREASDAYLASTGSRPKIFLANLGSVGDFTARSTFAKNFFESGGIEAVSSANLQNSDALSQAYHESKAKLICICSSDEVYTEQLIPTIMTLRRASKSPIYVAVRPGKLEEEAKRAGATAHIYAGCDVLLVLSEALQAACA